jgi:hypothetical protein
VKSSLDIWEKLMNRDGDVVSVSVNTDGDDVSITSRADPAEDSTSGGGEEPRTLEILEEAEEEAEEDIKRRAHA